MSSSGRQARKRITQRKPRTGPDFCSLTNGALERFRNIAQQVAHPGGSIVFKEGDPVNGVFLVCTGQVKLFAASPAGHTMILKIARPGDMLGLSATLNDLPHEVTAETLVPSTMTHIERKVFLDFLGTYAQAGYNTALAIAKEHREIFVSARRFALSLSASARVVQILMELARSDAKRQAPPCFPLMLTHAELASMAGTSRETVTRLLNQLERDGIISREDSVMTIHHLSRLEQLAQ